MERNIGLIGLIIAAVLVSGTVWAEESPTLFRGIRPLGMGGAFITLSDDENAVFYNPAGLNDVEGFGGVQIINPFVEVSENSVGIYKDVRDLNGDNIAQVTDYLDRHIGDLQHVRGAVFPNLLLHNFEIGFLANGVADLDIRNRANPQVAANIHLDAGVLAGVAYGFLDKMLQVGVTAKGIRREGLNHVYTPDEVASSLFDPYNQTTHHTDFAFDVGAKLNLPLLLHPTFAVVAQNLTDLDFKEAGKIGHQVNLGAAVNPDLWILKTTFAVEVDDVGRQQPGATDFYKRVHVGAEARFPAILAVQAGWNQGYISGGFSIDLWFLELGFATYAEELGNYAGQRADRRYDAQISLGF
jgi:hypothetical protein